jgi:hypothetical protein
LITFL